MSTYSTIDASVYKLIALKKLQLHDENWGQGRPLSLDVATICLDIIATIARTLSIGIATGGT